MGYPAPGTVVHQLGALFEGGSAAGLSDRQLLERFNARRDAAGEAAFAALVARHGPMVLGLCRQFLGDSHLAEDAFQAVFLVLARRAHSLRDPDLLGNWLYGVALRTARCARLRLAHRRRVEEAGTPVQVEPVGPSSPPVDEAAAAREQAEALHVEIERLPASFRLPVVLCYLEGLTVHEAARRLRWSHGTVRSRMARAREKLRRALTRRGVVLSTTAAAALLESRSASASVSSLLCETTTRAAIRFAAGPAARGSLAASSTALAQEVLKSMLIHKAKFIILAILFLGAVTTGAGLLTRSMAMKDEPKQAAANRAPAATAARPDNAAPGRMFVVGRVLDPTGKPVPNATVGVSMRRKLLFAGVASEGVFPAPAGHGTSDASGRFQLDAARTSSAHHSEFGATALAPGYGVGWADLDRDEDQPSAEIQLMPEQVIEGRLFDIDGQPAPGVVVSVCSIRRDLPPIAPGQGQSRERSEEISRWWGRVNDLPGWPKPATTDAEGRFRLHGIGRGQHAGLSVLDPRFAPQTIEIVTDADADVKTLKAVLQPTRTVTGRVSYADTGRPAPNAKVRISSNDGRGGVRLVSAETDAEGRFRVSPMPGDRLAVAASPLDEQPYFSTARELPWPKGAIEQSVDLALPRGLLLRGKVVEGGSDRPVADAMVSFHPYTPRLARRGGGGVARTKPDGSFAFAVGPRPGHLSVQAPGEDYQLQVTSNGQFFEGRTGGTRLYSHAFLPCNPRPGTEPPEIYVALRRGATVKVRLIGPDGQPARDVWVYSRAVLGPMATSAVRGWQGGYHDVARHGHFEVHGLDAETEVPVHFLQPDRKLGATVRLSGKMAARGPITVRLGPCGQAMARLVGPDGTPVAGRPRGLGVAMVVTPGPPRGSAEVRAGALAADEALLTQVDPVNHGPRLMADPQGRITWPALIPGATYRIFDRGAVAAPDDDPQVRREFAVGPGEAVELGDVLIQKPAG